MLSVHFNSKFEMASLLGSEYCVGSLRDDVSDLQTAVTDVVSRAGRINGTVSCEVCLEFDVTILSRAGRVCSPAHN